MCGRFTLRTNWALIARTFQLERWEDQRPRYNIAPESSVACIRHQAETGARELVPMQWGLIPSWAKDPTMGRKLINARGESVATKPSFRSAFRARRCLVLADGFYEWQRAGAKKKPFYIRLRHDQPFAMAGLWERWGGNGLELQTCTIITTDANSLLQPVHHRMPVILHLDNLDDWLDPDRGRGTELLQPYPSEELTLFPVSEVVNRATNNLPQCIEPLTQETQRPLF